MGRRFSTLKRVSLFLQSQGQCAKCRKPLSPGWHADHVHPYSKQGTTDILNGVALCPSCNLKKGAKDESITTIR
jgi:5-methylcytosine-specific restriction endonuclease McrA